MKLYPINGCKSGSVPKQIDLSTSPTLKRLHLISFCSKGQNRT